VSVAQHVACEYVAVVLHVEAVDRHGEEEAPKRHDDVVAEAGDGAEEDGPHRRGVVVVVAPPHLRRVPLDRNALVAVVAMIPAVRTWRVPRTLQLPRWAFVHDPGVHTALSEEGGGERGWFGHHPLVGFLH